jgi:hypothetical protein
VKGTGGVGPEGAPLRESKLYADRLPLPLASPGPVLRDGLHEFPHDAAHIGIPSDHDALRLGRLPSFPRRLTMGRRPARVNHPLGNSLVIDVGDFLAKDEVFQQ